MITIRAAADRGRGVRGWLDSRFTFSFADYYDRRHMGFRALRVINDDRISPSGGFGMHPHENMEILTWVLEGAVEHKDSTGTDAVIRPGEIQRMSAGTGIVHSEFNPSKTEPLHLLQIWLLPDENGLKPGYEQTFFSTEKLDGKLRPVATPDGKDGSVTIHVDARVLIGRFDAGQEATYKLSPGRHAWVQVARGDVDLNGQPLHEGDGAAITGEEALHLVGQKQSEVLVFDLA